jgi:hypothetical protein
MSKKIAVLAWGILFNSSLLQAQDKEIALNDSSGRNDSQSWQLSLATGDTLCDVALERIIGDSLFITHCGTPQAVCIEAISSMSLITKGTSFWAGTGIGFLVGTATSALFVYATNEEPTSSGFFSGLERSISHLTSIMEIILSGCLGGAIGGLIGDSSTVHDAYDLSSMPSPVKVKVVQNILERKPQNR